MEHIHSESVEARSAVLIGVEPVKHENKTIVKTEKDPDQIILFFLDVQKANENCEKQITAHLVTLETARNVVMSCLECLAISGDMLATKLKKEIEKHNSYECN